MIASRRILVGVVLVLVPALLPACLFDTREAQPPGQAGQDQVTLDSPDKPFLAMRKSLNESLTDANYERAISTNFIFSPTLQDSLDQNFIGTGVFDGWGKQVEIDALDLMLSDAKTIKVDFRLEPPLIQKSTFVRFRSPYALEIVNKSAPTDTLSYRGVAEIDVRLENGNWRVTFWNEVETVAGYTTWGYLRGILRSRLSP